MELDPGLAESILECGDELTAEHTAEHFDGKKKGVVGGDPASVVRSKAASGDYAVNMRMMLQSLIPGMEHAEEADLCAKVTGIAGDLQQGFSAGLKQQVVDQSLVLQCEGSEFPRECEDDVDIVGGQQFPFPCLEPAQAGVALAPWAMHANLSETLYRLDLSKSDFTEADLSDAFLSDAVLSNADLRRANLSRASLRNVNLTDASIGYTFFGDNDLSTVTGLETVRHRGPSVVGVDTIFRSQGNIPEIFLRGAGVPEDFIIYMRALVGHPVEFYSCFISYSTKDQDFADRLHSDLQSKGVRCWFAPHDLKGGKKVHEQIDDAIRHYDKLLLILSSHSMNSEWVKTEITKARKREIQENRRMLFPVSLVPFDVLRDWECFDADIGKDTAREIREYYIPDFSLWESHLL